MWTYCRSGFRSYLAQRLPAQSGWTDAASLSGGELTLRYVRADGSAAGPGYPVVTYAEVALAALQREAGQSSPAGPRHAPVARAG